jgi:hypothetical protein
MIFREDLLMKAITKYVADDGREFHSAQDCLDWEAHCARVAAGNEMLRKGHSLLDVLTRVNEVRPGWDSSLSAEDKTLLDKVTLQSKLTIEHWQCSKQPTYQPQRVDAESGKVHFWGQVANWVPPSGGLVSIADLLRYVRQTLKHCQATDLPTASTAA